MTARGASFALITVLCVLWIGGRLPDPAVFLADPDWGHQTAGANQILLGEHPFIDFRSTYGPLTFYASALAHVLSGGRVVGEMALVVLGYALAYVLLFRLMRIAAHTARVAWPVTVAALILMPRLYKYYIVLAPALTLTAAWAHVDRPGGRTVWALGFAIALAGLFRPDFGAFAALTGIAAVALRPAPGPAVRLWRILGLLGAVLACATPWLLWVGVRGGLGEYIADSIVGAPRHAAGMALPLPVLHGPESTHAGATALLAAFVFFAVLPLAAVVVLLFRRVAVDVGERARVLTLVVLAQATLLQAAHRSEVQHLLQAIPASFVLVAWLIGVAAGFLAAAIVGALLQILVFRRMEGQELRQTMVTIGISIVMADLMLAIWTGETYQFEPPDWLYGGTPLPFVKIYPTIRIMVLIVSLVVGVALWLFLTRTRIGMMIRAGVDDRGMLSASGVNVQRVFATTFAVGAGLAGFAGVVGGSALSISPGEDTRYLLASLIVVIVGGMGSVPGAAIGALMIGLAEQFGLAYSPTYSVVYTFLIMVAVLAIRPQGIMGRA